MAEQLTLLDCLDTDALHRFLAQVIAIENETDRLREELRTLKELYKYQLPLRAVLTAVKVVRAQRKLETHPKEPCARSDQVGLEEAVGHYLNAHDIARDLFQGDLGGLHATISVADG